MLDENKRYFKKILNDFMGNYRFKFRVVSTADFRDKTMTKEQLNQLGKTLWAIADQLRGAMNADDFRDYMLSFLFLRYLSDNYESAAKKELGLDYPELEQDDKRAPLGGVV